MLYPKGRTRMNLVTNMNRFSRIAAASFAVAGVLTLAACNEENKAAEGKTATDYDRSETLYIGGFDWAPPSTFNPLDYDPNFPIDGNCRIAYEALLAYNQLNGELEPMLADSYTSSENSITVHLDPRAKWNNGDPVTVDDVLYTFKIDSLLPTPRHGNWNFLSQVTNDGNNNITFHFCIDGKEATIT